MKRFSGLSQISKLIKPCMMAAAVAVVFAMYPTNSFGQECGSGNDTTCNVTTNYQIGSVTVLDEPGSNGFAAGPNALANNTAIDNTAVGDSALEYNTTGPHNTAVGADTLVFTTTGGDNTAMGFGALATNTTGAGNTAIGYTALNVSTGNSNTAVGNTTCNSVTSASNVICIGEGVAGTNTSNTTYVAGIYGTVLATTAKYPLVCVTPTGQLGTKGCKKAGAPVQEELIRAQQEQIQGQGKRIADLEQRLSQLESLVAKK